jgi:hypothetical protein
VLLNVAPQNKFMLPAAYNMIIFSSSPGGTTFIKAHEKPCPGGWHAPMKLGVSSGSRATGRVTQVGHVSAENPDKSISQGGWEGSLGISQPP